MVKCHHQELLNLSNYLPLLPKYCCSILGLCLRMFSLLPTQATASYFLLLVITPALCRGLCSAAGCSALQLHHLRAGMACLPGWNSCGNPNGSKKLTSGKPGFYRHINLQLQNHHILPCTKVSYYFLKRKETQSLVAIVLQKTKMIKPMALYYYL